ncbi:hypothetical protein SAMN06295998_10280 [Primorskyibacter flagellatus]|uniref:Uncharacterized protein n=2 Tax=Primorskyibacter flagellatus TaxID=1387277 RepID=A0A1W1ZQ71_9RHOB|nr:hypothetical protein SAMN06295998_10280 [Primorskyibacter flagellatus]
MLMTAEKPTTDTRQFGVVCQEPVVQLDAVETLREVFPGAAVHMFHDLSATSAELDALASCTVLLVIGPGLHFTDNSLPRRLAARGAGLVLVDCDSADVEAYGIKPIMVQQPFTSETLAEALRKV